MHEELTSYGFDGFGMLGEELVSVPPNQVNNTNSDDSELGLENCEDDLDDGGESDGDEEHGEDSGDDDEQQVAMYDMYGISGVNLGNWQLDILYNRGGGEALRKSMLVIDHGTSNTLGAAITCFKVHSSTGRTPYPWTHSDRWTSVCSKSYRPHWGVPALIFISYGRVTSLFACLPGFVIDMRTMPIRSESNQIKHHKTKDLNVRRSRSTHPARAS
jgi:hypothetical protein